MFFNIECRGVTKEIQLFVKKWNFSQSNIAWGKKTNKKQKKFYTWQTKLKPKKTEIFLLLIASVRRENKFWFFWKSKLPLKETRFGRKKSKILTFFKKVVKTIRNFILSLLGHFLKSSECWFWARFSKILEIRGLWNLVLKRPQDLSKSGGPYFFPYSGCPKIRGEQISLFLRPY